MGLQRCLLILWLAVAAAQGSEGPWWPQFHGPRRDNISDDRGLLKEWPPGGPKLLWKFSECGRGFSRRIRRRPRPRWEIPLEDEERPQLARRHPRRPNHPDLRRVAPWAAAPGPLPGRSEKTS